MPGKTAMQNVVFRGEDMAAGAPIAACRNGATPAHLGVLAGQGYPEVPGLAAR